MSEIPLRNVKRFRGGLVFKAHKTCVSLNSRLECNKEEEDPPEREETVIDANTAAMHPPPRLR